MLLRDTHICNQQSWFIKTFWNDKEKIKESFDIVSQIIECERWRMHWQNNTSRGQASVSVDRLTVSPPTDGFLLQFHVLMCQLAHRKLAWAPKGPSGKFTQRLQCVVPGWTKSFYEKTEPQPLRCKLYRDDKTLSRKMILAKSQKLWIWVATPSILAKMSDVVESRHCQRL